LEDLEAEVEINNACETIRKHNTISSYESLGYYGLKGIGNGSMKDAQNYYIKGNKLNCSGYMIQVK
jgi:hypothetical protein